MKQNTIIIFAAFLLFGLFANTHVVADTVLFSDNFDRPSSDSLGNGWSVIEDGITDVDISNNKMFFDVTDDAHYSPIASHTFTSISSGVLSWSFNFEWYRTNTDNNYRVYMQMGDSNSMTSSTISDPEMDDGVGVNLVWTVMDEGHESLGYVYPHYYWNPSYIARVDGYLSPNIQVFVDIDAEQYSVFINDSLVSSGIDLYSDISSIDTVRLITYDVNQSSFNRRSFDNIVVSSVDPVPVPSTIYLFGTGLIGLAGLRRRIKK